MSSKTENPEFTRILVMLQSEEKEKRKSGLKEIIKVLGCLRSEEQISRLWEAVNRSLSRSLCDSTEACRDQTVEILLQFLNNLSPHDKHIMYVLPIMSRRLGSPEQIESSEEVRLKCINLLKIIILKYKDYLPAYIDDITKILERTVQDNFPLVKRESCDCISVYAKNLPRHFYVKSEILVKPILSNFTHQHYRVRVASVKTIGDVLQYGNSKSMEEVATPLAERLFDQSGAVRRAVVEVAGLWLLELRDRYSWWHKIIPLLLTGLHDELEEIREKASTLWDSAGRLYMQENQYDEKLKDKMDFLVNNPSHYPNVSRPNLGCRVIAQQNLCKLINGISVELGDWKADIRVRSAQLLCVLVLNVEEDVTQHIEKLLPAMYRASNDDDTRVAENIDRAALYMGYFVHPKIYCCLVIPTLEGAPSAGHLRVFSSILKGSERNALLSYLNKIANFLCQPHICQSKKSNYQKQILSCCHSLLIVCKEDCETISEQLFTVIFTVLSMARDSSLKEEAQQLLQILANVNLFESIDDLYHKHVGKLLSSCHDCESWSIYNAESEIFCACLTYAEKAVSYNMDTVLSILKRTMASGADPELRLKQFLLLTNFFHQGPSKALDLNQFLRQFLEDCIFSGLIWTAGRAAEALRTAAVSCLHAFLQNNITRFTEEDYGFIFEKIIPVLISMVDENSKQSRLFSLRAIYSIVSIGRDLNCITQEHIHKIYPVVLKRLDDGCDDVRYTSLEALVGVWKCAPKDYDTTFNKGHVDSLYTTAVIHLDDPEKNFQDTMLGGLKELAKIHPEYLYQKLLNSKANFRNQEGIDVLLQYCQDLMRHNEIPRNSEL